jgi:16S rRNA (cytosine1402-N4)-methyltransferase
MAHVSVLLQEAIAGLDIDSGDIFVDATLGSGGHSAAVVDRFGSGVRIIGIDADADAISRTKENLKGSVANIIYVQDNFRNLDSILDGLGIKQIDKILFDLGMSSNQLEESGRGFSFQRNEPLLMTFEKPSEKDQLTAYEIVNYWDEKEIREILRLYGEEKYANRIAKAMVSERKISKIGTTGDLVQIILQSVPKGYKGRIHPATRTFQALRIATNDELTALPEGLDKAFRRLSREGRMAVISFHSLEDRIVKNFFRDRVIARKAVLINNLSAGKAGKPIEASEEELRANPRSRSAKLRIIEKK